MFKRRKSREDALEEALLVYTTSSYSPTNNTFPTPSHSGSEKQPLPDFRYPPIDDTNTVDYTDSAYDKTPFLVTQIKTIFQRRLRLTLSILLGLLTVAVILAIFKQSVLEGWSKSFYPLHLGEGKVIDFLAEIDAYLARREDERREFKDDSGRMRKNNPAVSIDQSRPPESPIWPRKRRSASDASSTDASLTSHSSPPPRFFTEMSDPSSQRVAAGHSDPTLAVSISDPEANWELTIREKIALYMTGLLFSIPLAILYLFTVLGLFVLMGNMFWFIGQTGFDAMTSVGILLLYKNGTVAE